MPDLLQTGQILRTLNGHSEMASIELKGVPGGFWAWVPCRLDRGDLPADQQEEYNPVRGHWLAPSEWAPGWVRLQTEPYVWPSSSTAIASMDQWIKQQ